MREALTLIIVLLLVYVYGSTLLFWYWAFKGKKEIIHGDKKGYYYLCIGSLIGVGMFFYFGFDKVLFFIPSSWGFIDEDGDFVSLKFYLAGFLAFVASLFIHSRPHQLVAFFKSKEDSLNLFIRLISTRRKILTIMQSTTHIIQNSQQTAGKKAGSHLNM